MPAAASYIRGNDYNVLKFSPFSLPVNDIAKTILTDTEYWNQGASRVKARYDDALNLTLTNPENQQIKKDYMMKSDEMLRSLNSQNLGNPDVQQAGIGIYKNLFEDRGIMFDDQLTKHFGKVHNDYYALLKKDPKKASMVNLAYAIEDAEAFKNDPDRTSAEEYYNRRREYTPYYDPTDDIDQAMKYCHPSSNTQQQPAGNTLTGYSVKESNKGLSSAQVSECFQAGLSGQAKQQLNINGYMAFRNNKPALASEYSSYLNKNSQLLLGERGKMAVHIADLQKRQKLGKTTKQEDDAIEQYTEADKTYQEKIRNNTNIVNRLNLQDYSPLDEDYEGISGMIYTNMKTSQFGSAYSYDEYSRMMIDDPVQMLKIRQIFEANKQEDEQSFEYGENTRQMDNSITLAKIRAAATNSDLNSDGTPKVIGNDLLSPLNIGTETPTIDGYKDMMNDIKEVDGSIAMNNQYLKQRLLEDDAFAHNVGALPSGIGNTKVSELPADQFANIQVVKDYIANAKSNPKIYQDVATWRRNNRDLKINEALIKSTYNKLESQVPKELLDRSYLKKIDPIVFSDGSKLTSDFVQDIIEGKESIGIKTKKYKTSISNLSVSEVEGIESFTFGTKVFTNKKDTEALEKYIHHVRNANLVNNSKINKTRAELYKNENYRMTHMFDVTDQKNPAVVAFKQQLAQIPKGDVKEEATTHSYDPATGDVIVTIPGMDASDENSFKSLHDAGFNVEKVGDGKNYTHLFKFKSVPGFNESVKRGLDSRAVNSAMLLKRATEPLLKDARVPVGKTIFSLDIPVRVGNLDMDWEIQSVKIANGTNIGVEYILLDEKKAEIKRSQDPFELMKSAKATEY